jgi:hypothetical protein
MQAYTKAIVAALSGILEVIALFTVPPEWLNPTTIATIGAFLGTVLVYALPNKA